jgi:hypothetical protein
MIHQASMAVDMKQVMGVMTTLVDFHWIMIIMSLQLHQAGTRSKTTTRETFNIQHSAKHRSNPSECGKPTLKSDYPDSYCPSFRHAFHFDLY